MTGLITAFDIGGTLIKAAAFDRDLNRITTRRVPTARSDDPSRAAVVVADQIAELAGELDAETGPAEAIGVAVPGIVDEMSGTANYSANLGWRDAPMRDLLARRLRRPVAITHDVRAGGLAEAKLGAGQGFGDLVFLAAGTGIASALVLGGKPHSGAGYAGEIGHVNIGHDVKCGCGATGCVEAIASAGAIARRYTERTGHPVDGSAQVVAAAHGDDLDARAVVDDAIDGLAKALLVLARIVAPQLFVLGGGLFASGEVILGPIRERLAELVRFQPPPVLRLAELGGDAGTFGAALTARDLP